LILSSNKFIKIYFIISNIFQNLFSSNNIGTYSFKLSMKI